MKKALLVAGLVMLVMLVAISCGKKPESTLWSEAQALEENGDYNKAITQYDVMLKLYPQSKLRFEVLFRNGLMCLSGLEDLPKAEEYFTRIQNEAPRSTFGEGASALINLITGDMAGDKAEILYHCGIAYTNLLAEYDIGVGLLDKIVVEYPDAPRAAEAQFMKGFVWANSAKDTANARTEYVKFLQQYPDHELSASVKWELEYLGKDINEIPEMKNLAVPAGNK